MTAGSPFWSTSAPTSLRKFRTYEMPSIVTSRPSIPLAFAQRVFTGTRWPLARFTSVRTTAVPDARSPRNQHRHAIRRERRAPSHSCAERLIESAVKRLLVRRRIPPVLAEDEARRIVGVEMRRRSIDELAHRDGSFASSRSASRASSSLRDVVSMSSAAGPGTAPAASATPASATGASRVSRHIAKRRVIAWLPSRVPPRLCFGRLREQELADQVLEHDGGLRELYLIAFLEKGFELPGPIPRYWPPEPCRQDARVAVVRNAVEGFLMRSVTRARYSLKS